MKRFIPLIMLFAACTNVEDVTYSETEELLDTTNGESLNGESLNGESLNGESLNGESLNGPSPGSFAIYISLQNVTLGGSALDTASLSASIFSGTRGEMTFTGADFVGAEFDAVRGDGTTVRMRITEMVQQPTRASYFVSYYGTDGAWHPSCVHDGQPIDSYALEGTWDHHQEVEGGGSWSADPSRFTFACRTLGALAKCIDIGYEPWQVQDHHLACVRMLRADYCRNGRPYTTTGRRINVYDSLGIQVDTNEWHVDAEWDAGGARCFTSHNRASAPVSCYDAVAAETCGDLAHFGASTLIMNEIP